MSLKTIFLLIFVTLNGGLFSCGDLILGGKTEGYIEYEVSYPLPNESNLAESMLPSTVSYYYKKGKTLTVISAGMGVFTTRIFTDLESKKLTSALEISLMAKKVKTELTEEAINKQIDKERKMILQKTNDTLTIAGYLCHKAICIFPDSSLPNLDVYYTKELKHESPNWYSPYRELDGVLMEFFIHRYGVHMKLRAKEVRKEKIEAEKFELEDGFKSISQEEMDTYYKI